MPLTRFPSVVVLGHLRKNSHVFMQLQHQPETGVDFLQGTENDAEQYHNGLAPWFHVHYLMLPCIMHSASHVQALASS